MVIHNLPNNRKKKIQDDLGLYYKALLIKADQNQQSQKGVLLSDT